MPYLLRLLGYFIEDTRSTGNGALAISKILANTPFTGISDIETVETAYYQMMSLVRAILGADNSFIEIWDGEIERDNFLVKMKKRIDGRLQVESPLIGNYVNVKTTRIHYSDIKVDEETSEAQAIEALRNTARQEFENSIDKP